LKQEITGTHFGPVFEMDGEKGAANASLNLDRLGCLESCGQFNKFGDVLIPWRLNGDHGRWRRSCLDGPGASGCEEADQAEGKPDQRRRPGGLRDSLRKEVSRSGLEDGLMVLMPHRP